MTSLSVVFISDVHVAPASSVEPFLDFLRTLPGRSRALFILGDLFDLWTGHADADQLLRHEAHAIPLLVRAAMPTPRAVHRRAPLVRRGYTL